MSEASKQMNELFAEIKRLSGDDFSFLGNLDVVALKHRLVNLELLLNNFMFFNNLELDLEELKFSHNGKEVEMEDVLTGFFRQISKREQYLVLFHGDEATCKTLTRKVIDEKKKVYEEEQRRIKRQTNVEGD